MICRDRDTDTETSGLESREYVLQNWRADVVALAAPAVGEGEDGDLLERVSYDPYGIPFGTHPTDLTRGAVGGVTGYGMPDGALNNDDYSYFLILYGASNWRADWDRDGDIDAADNTAYTNDKNAASGSWGRGVLSNRENILGYAGYVHEPATGAAGGGHGTMWHVRHRVMHSGLGRWVQRDPERFQYGEGMSLYWYGADSPVVMTDWQGGACSPLTGCPSDPAPPSGGGGYGPHVCDGLNVPNGCASSPFLWAACEWYKMACGLAGPPSWVERPQLPPGREAQFCCNDNSLNYRPGVPCETLAHELLHAADWCRRSPNVFCGIKREGRDFWCGGPLNNPSGCDWHACTEARGNAWTCCDGANLESDWREAEWNQCMKEQRDSYQRSSGCAAARFNTVWADCQPDYISACRAFPIGNQPPYIGPPREERPR